MKEAEKLIKNIEKKMREKIDVKFSKLLDPKDQVLNHYLERQKSAFLNEKKQKLKENFPFEKDVNEYDEFISNKDKLVGKIEVDKLQNISLRVGSPFQRKWWEEKFKTSNLRNLMGIEWKKNLNSLVESWEIEQLDMISEEITNRFEKKLNRVRELKEIVSLLEFNTGSIWDLTEESVLNTDIDTLIKWINYLKENKDIKDLCDLLGKMIVYNENLKNQKNLSLDEEVAIPKINSKEEISRVKLGNTIEALLPSELSLLNNSDLELLFDLKFVENKLMIYDFQDSQNIKVEDTEQKNQKDELEGRGPIIICLDTSGSMSGSRERVAKAICFSLISRAISQKRDCMLINFSVKIEVTEFDKVSNFSEIFDFLTKSFYGGTDAVPALTYSLDAIQKKKYSSADIIMVSDFLLETIDEDTEKRIKDAQKLNNKFYSVAIGNLNMEKNLEDLFEKQWSYNPQIGSIELLNEIVFNCEK